MGIQLLSILGQLMLKKTTPKIEVYIIDSSTIFSLARTRITKYNVYGVWEKNSTSNYSFYQLYTQNDDGKKCIFSPSILKGIIAKFPSGKIKHLQPIKNFEGTSQEEKFRKALRSQPFKNTTGTFSVTTPETVINNVKNVLPTCDDRYNLVVKNGQDQIVTDINAVNGPTFSLTVKYKTDYNSITTETVKSVIGVFRGDSPFHSSETIGVISHPEEPTAYKSPSTSYLTNLHDIVKLQVKTPNGTFIKDARELRKNNNLIYYSQQSFYQTNARQSLHGFLLRIYLI